MAMEIIEELSRHLTRCRIALVIALAGDVILAIALIIR